jgi:ABC-type oligopeptide transport system ATPase subunit
VAETALAVEGLSKVFAGRGSAAEVVAVDDVSFAVPAGASLAVVGESGSGKTTIARMIVGLETPSAGRIVIGGHERPRGPLGSRARRSLAREVQIVFQDPYSSLDRRQRIFDCIDEVLRLHFRLSRQARDERVMELLGQVGLDARHAGVLPSGLSGGQRQRVAIARALASEPKILLLDEAVASLDVSIQAQVLNLLADIRADTGITYLFISHDLAVVRQVSDAVAVMHRGTIVERGETGRVLDAPEHPYTQKLLNAIPRPGWKPTRGAHGAPADLHQVEATI